MPLFRQRGCPGIRPCGDAEIVRALVSRVAAKDDSPGREPWGRSGAVRGKPRQGRKKSLVAVLSPPTGLSALVAFPPPTACAVGYRLAPLTGLRPRNPAHPLVRSSAAHTWLALLALRQAVAHRRPGAQARRPRVSSVVFRVAGICENESQPRLSRSPKRSRIEWQRVARVAQPAHINSFSRQCVRLIHVLGLRLSCPRILTSHRGPLKEQIVRDALYGG